MGALITMKQMPHNAWREARLALAGPLLGSAAALLLYILGPAYDSQQLKALAFLGFLLNLFILLPVIPLDGGRITAALHPALWFAGLLALLALVIYRPNPILIIILLLAGSELRRRWQTRRAPQMQDYYRVRPQQRLLIGGALLRARSRARSRHARHTGPPQLLAERAPTPTPSTTARESKLRKPPGAHPEPASVLALPPDGRSGEIGCNRQRQTDRSSHLGCGLLNDLLPAVVGNAALGIAGLIVAAAIFASVARHESNAPLTRSYRSDSRCSRSSSVTEGESAGTPTTNW